MLLAAGRAHAAGPLEWYAEGRWHPLVAEPARVVIFASSESPAEPPAALRTMLDGASITVHRAEPLLYRKRPAWVYKVPVALDAAQVEPLVAALSRSLNPPGEPPSALRVMPYLEPAPGTTPLIPTGRVFLRLRAGVAEKDLAAFAAQHGLTALRPLPHEPRVLSAETSPLGSSPVRVCQVLVRESGLVEWAHPDFLVRRRTTAFPVDAPRDPLYFEQWNLQNTGQRSGIAGNDINIRGAWLHTIGERDVRVAVIDSGVEVGHPDLAPNYVAGWDVLDNDNNPRPAFDPHGTSVAGIVSAAADTNKAIAGVAPGCGMVAIRLVENNFTFADEAEAFQAAFDRNASVITNSWGPDDFLGVEQPLPDIVRTEIDRCYTLGRKGKGAVIVWAAGNGRPTDTCDEDGYARYDKVICVGSSTNLGQHASYSEECAAIDLSAPSAGGTAGIPTTRGATGTTLGFGGTSAAAPHVAGVAALLLSCHPDLNNSQVYRALTATATKIDTSGGAYDSTGHSRKYGYGRVNAKAALEYFGACGLTTEPTPSITPTSSPTRTPTRTPTTTATPSPTVSPTLSATPTATPSPSATPCQVEILVSGVPQMVTCTPTRTPTGTPTSSPTETGTRTPTPCGTTSPPNPPSVQLLPQCVDYNITSIRVTPGQGVSETEAIVTVRDVTLDVVVAHGTASNGSFPLPPLVWYHRYRISAITRLISNPNSYCYSDTSYPPWENEFTYRCTPTPSPTPTATQRPGDIFLAGYMDTRLTSSEGGTVLLIAYVPIPSGHQRAQGLDLFLEGVATQLVLSDNGVGPDTTAGDGVYSFSIPVAPGIPAPFSVLLEIGTHPANASYRQWPYLVVR